MNRDPRIGVRASRVRRRGLSMIELLVALVISGTLLAASVQALNATFRSYQVTTEQASQHMVSRLVMSRLAGVIRTGAEFGPYPVNPVIQPVIETDRLEFVAQLDPDTQRRQIWRIQREAVVDDRGPYILTANVDTFEGATLVNSTSRPLLWNVRDLKFTLEYEPGRRLRRATIDLTVAKDEQQKGDSLGALIDIPITRFVTSVSPRRID